jgi:hypothetical protein
MVYFQSTPLINPFSLGSLAYGNHKWVCTEKIDGKVCPNKFKNNACNINGTKQNKSRPNKRKINVQKLTVFYL